MDEMRGMERMSWMGRMQWNGMGRKKVMRHKYKYKIDR
jgi:hypothetical protein